MECVMNFMKPEDTTGFKVFGCAVLKAELQALREQHWPDLHMDFLSSMLHMWPDKLGRKLDDKVKEQCLQQQKTLLVYGDCCTEMTDFTQRPGVARVRGNNCCDLLLGRKIYRKLSHDGIFFLLPEWARRWRHIFSIELGLDENNAAALMGDMHTKLLYLDTGILPVPVQDLKECSAYCQLPWEVMTVSLEPLRQAIQNALDDLNKFKDSE
jgi:hypothetical protein